jgi:hypothetical protein
MLKRRVAVAFAFAAVMLLGRGALALASANAFWNPAVSDPTTVDISEISGLLCKTVLYTDPMDDVRRSLLVLLRPTGVVPPASSLRPDEGVPRAHRPRAPPAV